MTVVTTDVRGPIAILRLNRPDAMNALGADGDGEAVRAAAPIVQLPDWLQETDRWQSTWVRA